MEGTRFYMCTYLDMQELMLAISREQRKRKRRKLLYIFSFVSLANVFPTFLSTPITYIPTPNGTRTHNFNGVRH
jgi:hypothetical protein